ncbi:ABC transporter substrate-binding protein [Schleiferilactobacillus harbinensis]|jgi:multiple sugar transport system substrate-binding protein|uniref:ABC transporter substrate-binding protein n=1 Tax=Schleiferilactobacillus harbinensis TaxID=304207 RepID=UPI002672FF31|nr:ABC transporter substrate-binding protein [Schleiferilactobacillus harbinensis]MCI1688374.1 ABC transporter substrate-binding protein [Schleiferilactobacillus harbinensis]
MKLGRFLTAAATLAAAVILAGCSGGSGSSSTPGGGTSSSGRTKITFWYRMNGIYEKALKSYITDFNKSQKQYEVVGTSQGSYDDLQKKLLAAAKSRTLPTMSQVTDITVPEYIKNGFILPLDNVALKGSDKLTDKELADIYPGIRQNLKYQGKYYTMPFATGTRIMFYNKDILDKYKLSVPKNWEDFAAISQKLKGTGITTVGFNKSYDFELETLAYDAGNRLVTPQLKVNLTTPATLAAGNAIVTMLHDKTAASAGTDVYFNVPFVQGKMFAGFGSSATIQQLKNTAPKTMHWGTALMPGFQGKESNVLGNNGLGLFKGASAKQQQGAWQFMKYLMSSKVQADWGEKTGYVPVVKSAVTSASYQAFLKKNPEYQAAVDAYEKAFSSTPFVGYNEYRNDLYAAVDATISKGESAKTALTALQKQTEQIIQDNK